MLFLLRQQVRSYRSLFRQNTGASHKTFLLVFRTLIKSLSLVKLMAQPLDILRLHAAPPQYSTEKPKTGLDPLYIHSLVPGLNPVKYLARDILARHYKAGRVPARAKPRLRSGPDSTSGILLDDRLSDLCLFDTSKHYKRTCSRVEHVAIVFCQKSSLATTKR